MGTQAAEVAITVEEGRAIVRLKSFDAADIDAVRAAANDGFDDAIEAGQRTFQDGCTGCNLDPLSRGESLLGLKLRG